LTDDADIMQQTRSLYARANMIIRKLFECPLHSKLMLSRAYCTSLYGCRLWSAVRFLQLRMAYNDAFIEFY